MTIHSIYIASPYSSPTRAGIEKNIATAAIASARCIGLGHFVYCPHTASDGIGIAARAIGVKIGYERWMRQCFDFIENWATALLYLESSPGADRELKFAKELGLVIFRSRAEVPNVREKKS